MISEENNYRAWCSLEYSPLEIPPIKSTNAGILAKNQVVKDQGFIESLFENIKFTRNFGKKYW